MRGQENTYSCPCLLFLSQDMRILLELMDSPSFFLIIILLNYDKAVHWVMVVLYSHCGVRMKRLFLNATLLFKTGLNIMAHDNLVTLFGHLVFELQFEVIENLSF